MDKGKPKELSRQVKNVEGERGREKIKYKGKR